MKSYQIFDLNQALSSEGNTHFPHKVTYFKTAEHQEGCGVSEPRAALNLGHPRAEGHRPAPSLQRVRAQAARQQVGAVRRVWARGEAVALKERAKSKRR